MPIYMDLHIVPGVNAKDVAEAHSRDVYLEKDHNCKCLTYWIDEMRGHVFCLIDAPSKETVFELHNRAHGLVPHKIIDVQNDFVESFLGRITDPETDHYTDTGLLMIEESSYRIIMCVNTTDPILLQHKIGLEAAVKKVGEQHQVIRDEIKRHAGREALHEGQGVLGSFITAENAVHCALAILEQWKDLNDDGMSVRIHAGEPVAQTDQLFGDTIQLLQGLRLLNRKQCIVISNAVKELIAKDMLHKRSTQLLALSIPDELFFTALFDAMGKQYSDNDFSADDYAQLLTTSKSQMYRRITALTGYSPNDLVKEYRLEKSKELLRKKKHNVNEVALQSGFTSASYFTKCFKAKFGLLPLAYQQLV